MTIKEAYQKERKRLLSAINRAEKKGVIFPENLVPKAPKRATAQSVQRLSNIRTTMFEKASVLDTETGEITPYKTKQRTTSKPIKKARSKTENEPSSISSIRIPKGANEPSSERLSEAELKRIRSEASKKAWKTRRASMTDEQYEEYKRKFIEKVTEGRKRKEESLTEAQKEERKRKRSEASKKSAKTRYERMTPEEREKQKRDFVERMRKAREKKKQEQGKPKEPTQEHPKVPAQEQPKLPQEIPPTEEYIPQFGTIDALRNKIESMPNPQVYVFSVGYQEYNLDARKSALLAILEDNITYYGEEAYEEYLNGQGTGGYSIVGEISELIDEIVYYDSDDTSIEVHISSIARLLNYNTPLTKTQAESIAREAEYMTE